MSPQTFEMWLDIQNVIINKNIYQTVKKKGSENKKKEKKSKTTPQTS